MERQLTFQTRLMKWVVENGREPYFRRLFDFRFSLSVAPPDGKSLWSAYLGAIASSSMLDISVQDYRPWKQLLETLNSLSSVFQSELRLEKALSHTIVSFLPHGEQEALRKKLFPFFSHLEEWAEGKWHQKLINTPFEAAKEVFRILSFDDMWQCARFITNCGYWLPHSQRAYRVWLLWSGEPEGENAYFHWHEVLEKMGTEYSDRAYFDFICGQLFSASERKGSTEQLCLANRNCRDCPLNEDCHYAKHYAEGEATRHLTNRILTESNPDIPTDRLIVHLYGDRWHSPSRKHFWAKKYETLSDKDFSLLDNKEDHKGEEREFLAFLKGLQLITRRTSGKKSIEPGKIFRCSREIFDFLNPTLGKENQESFYTLILDNKNRTIQLHLISKGTLNQSLVHPREVFAPAIQLRAASIILIHNHPSGDAEPSRQDNAITKRLFDVGKVVGIEVLDHIIVGSQGYFSFVDNGKMPE